MNMFRLGMENSYLLKIWVMVSSQLPLAISFYMTYYTYPLYHITCYRLISLLSIIVVQYGFCIQDKISNNIILSGPCKDGLYPIPDSLTTTRHALSIQCISSITWHNRLGHPSHRILNKIVSSFSLPIANRMLVQCDHCHVGKSHKLPFTKSISCTNTPLELLHMDVWEPSSLQSHKCFRYYLLIIDDYSRFSWFFPIYQKSDVYNTFVGFVSRVENQFHHEVKMIRSGNGHYTKNVI